MSLPSSKISYLNLFSQITFENKEIMDFWNSWQLSDKLKEEINGEGEVVIEENDTWHSISEQLYGTRELWWVLALYNEVEDPFSLFFGSGVPTGLTKIKVIKADYIDIIVNEIRNKRIEKEKNGL